MDNPILKDKYGRDVAIKDGDILALTEMQGEYTGLTLYYVVIKRKCGYYYISADSPDEKYIIYESIPYKKFRTREFEIISNIYNYLRFFKGDKDGK